MLEAVLGRRARLKNEARGHAYSSTQFCCHPQRHEPT